jgi:hypothetical protein
MESLYLWPEKPVLSLLLLCGLSMLFLWAAREPVLALLRGVGRSLESGLTGVSHWCKAAADRQERRNREALLAACELELRARMERELHRIDASFSEKLGQWANLHRRLDDLLTRLDGDYQNCGDSPPEVPGWGPALEAVTAIPAAGDPKVQKVLQGIRESFSASAKRVLALYREETSKRHRLLGRMRPYWKEIRSLLSRMKEIVARCLQATVRIDGCVDEFQRIASARKSPEQVLHYSATKPFVISLIVLAVALAGAFINFQLIALPMSELVPAGARVGGVQVATVAALVLVLMETAVGIFVMDMLEITDLFPKLARVSVGRRRLILGLGLAGLFFLAAVESSLAVLREQIVEADAALKLSLAGATETVVAAPARSAIPVIGQAVLGFVLPWILAMVAIPLESFIDSSRHVASRLCVVLLRGVGCVAGALAHGAGTLTVALAGLYDVWVSIPLRFERMIRGDQATRRGATAPAPSAEQRAATPLPRSERRAGAGVA